MSSGERTGDRDGERVHIVLVTGPDRETLERIGRRVVEERLAACANVWDGIGSIFRWSGEVQEATEALTLLKTTGGRLDALRERIRKLHPYDEPEFLALAVDSGSATYLGWVVDSVAAG